MIINNRDKKIGSILEGLQGSNNKEKVFMKQVGAFNDAMNIHPTSTVSERELINRFNCNVYEYIENYKKENKLGDDNEDLLNAIFRVKGIR